MFQLSAVASHVRRGVSAAGLGLMLAMPFMSAHAGDQDFVLHNETGVDIQELYVSPSSKSDWEEDILGVDVLPDGDSVEISFSRDEDAELWDLKVTDSAGGSLLWGRLNLLEISELTLRFDNGKATALAQ